MRLRLRLIFRWIPALEVMGYTTQRDCLETFHGGVLRHRQAWLPEAQVAQSVEQGTENPRVGSSTLSLGTNTKIRIGNMPVPQVRGVARPKR